MKKTREYYDGMVMGQNLLAFFINEYTDMLVKQIAEEGGVKLTDDGAGVLSGTADADDPAQAFTAGAINTLDMLTDFIRDTLNNRAELFDIPPEICIDQQPGTGVKQ